MKGDWKPVDIPSILKSTTFSKDIFKPKKKITKPYSLNDSELKQIEKDPFLNELLVSLSPETTSETVTVTSSGSASCRSLVESKHISCMAETSVRFVEYDDQCFQASEQMESKVNTIKSF